MTEPATAKAILSRIIHNHGVHIIEYPAIETTVAIFGDLTIEVNATEAAYLNDLEL